MTIPDPPPPEPTPWDRIGIWLGDVATVSTTIANRNLRLWTTSTTGGDGRIDWSRWVDTASANARDLSALWLGISPRERIAYPLPVASLEFQQLASGSGPPGWALTQQVVIPVAFAGVMPLPDSAEIQIAGDDAAGAAALQACLRARLGTFRMAYLLESVDVRDLVPGLYSGLVYLESPASCPLAELRILVDGPAGEPEVPTVVLHWGFLPGPDTLATARWTPDGPIVLRPPAGGPAPPAHVRVALTGGAAARELAAALTVVPDAAGRAYELTAADPPSEAEGLYVGAAYAMLPQPRALASLEVVVEPELNPRG